MKLRLQLFRKGLCLLLLGSMISSMAIAQKILDNLTTQPICAYSVRLLKTSYTGAAMQIRRSNDDQLVDVYFNASGNVALNSPISAAGGGPVTSALLSEWVGSNSAYVRKWYDQSGNSNHAAQNNTSEYQPRIINAGALELLPNGTPTLKMLNAATGGTGFNLPFTLSGITELNLFMAVREDGKIAGSDAGHLFGSSGATGPTPGKLQIHYNNTSASNTFGMQSATAYGSNRLNLVNGNFYNVRFKLSSENGGTSQIFTSLISSIPVANSLTTAFDATAVTLFRLGSNTYNRNLDGVCSEVIFFANSITETDANTILTNQNSNYISVSPVSSIATNIGSDEFTANWQPPTGGISGTSTYKFQYSTTPDFSSGNVLFTNIAVLNRTIKSLTPETQYWYRILINTGGVDGGDGAWSTIQTLTTTAVLPIKLQGFDVKKSNLGAELKWSTASEKDNNYFDIERSTDGLKFDIIGNTAGVGNSSSKVDYNFIDKIPFLGTNYYRLKQVDLNGDFEYSPIISLDYTLLGDNQLIVYANPVIDRLRFVWAGSGANRDVAIKVIDLSGKVLKSFRQNSFSEINVADLSNGIYFIEVSNTSGKKESAIAKFIKQ